MRFTVCLSTDVKRNQVIGRDFLDGRIAIYRDGDSEALPQVSAYCPHLGWDLSCGHVIDGRLRCPFHHWQFDGSGRFIRTGTDDPVPRAARLFSFPVQEHREFVTSSMA